MATRAESAPDPDRPSIDDELLALAFQLEEAEVEDAQECDIKALEVLNTMLL
jgi:hypothetical protein